MREIITKYELIDKQSWSNFVKSHPQGNVFQSPEMYELYLSASFIHPIVVASVCDGQVDGILVVQSLSSKNPCAAWLTSRCIIMGGPLALNKDKAIIDDLMTAYRSLIPLKTIYTEIRPIYDSAELFQHLSTRKWKRIGHYNILLPLDKSVDELYNQMHKERRRNVQTAIKNGLTFEEVSSPEKIKNVVALIKQTYLRKHVPISYLDMFEQVLSILGDYAHFFACYAQDGKMIAGQLRLCYNQLVYAWFAGSDEAYFKQRPNDFLMWNVIAWSQENGYQVFDFGGGGEPGVEYGVRDYKMKYGCEIYDYGRMLYTHRPITYFLAQKAYKLYHKLKGK